ncbi:MAG: hypothetical protein EOM66_10805, partial [Clostridia bacterium]|nr:hypothetical protein [Clostridia bacterium]
VAIFIDGTPFVLTAPLLFIEHFQSSEDYYMRAYFSSFIRIIRFIAYFITLCAPAIYVALTTFHQELIPTQLLFTLVAGHSNIPFPAAVEAAVMLMTFDILREAGIRLPQAIGSAISIVGAFVGYVGADSRHTTRSIDFQKARIAAEAALEHGTIQLKNIILRNRLDLLSRSELDALLAAIPPPPTLDTYAYQTPGGSLAFEVISTSDVEVGPVARGTYSPRMGEAQTFRVRAGAINPGTGVGAVMARDIQGVGLFLIRFGVFYEEVLEIAPGANMSFAGWVHSNGDIYLDSQASLTFSDSLTAAGNMFRGRLDRTQYNAGSVRVNNAAGTAVSMNIDSDSPTWMTDSMNLWNGRVLSRSHGYPRLDAPIDPTDTPHDIIERPLPTGTPGRNESTENEKFSNKACLTLRIHADNSLTAVDSRGNDVSSYFTTAVLRVSGTTGGKPLYSKNSASNYVFTKKGAYGVTNHFYDAREEQTMAPVDIYVDALTNSFAQVANATYSV